MTFVYEWVCRFIGIGKPDVPSSDIASNIPVRRPENWFGIAKVNVGTKHLRADPPVPCQDSALVCAEGAVRPCAFVADGAGSASLSHYGSHETILRLSHFAAALDDIHVRMLDEQGEEPSEKECHVHAFRFLAHVSETIKCLAMGEDKPYKEFRSTLLVVIVGAERMFWIKVGDGHIVAEKQSGELSIIGPLGKGEYANVTQFVDETPGKTNFSCGVLPTAEISGFALMTDGAAEKLVSTDGKKVAPRISKFLEGIRNQTFGEQDLHDFLSDPEVYNPAKGYTGDDKGMALLAQKKE